MSLFSFLNPAVKVKPIEWRRKSFHSENEWIGSAGPRWGGMDLFKVRHENFIETGETYCLYSQLNTDCVVCYPTLQQAQDRAQEQLEKLVKDVTQNAL